MLRLKTIKLAGFKSFVDPTTVHLKTNLISVVGPNGCGKSNIIDAVRWVMGESSAKNLRGESSTDVIFNGSSGRKPVGQASVELIFDNQDGALGGQYAEYNEISVRRVVNRVGENESQSNYFFNGTRCRRRDITDVFMGTGLGPRSYSIIQQGTISRFVEAKPEELRKFVEETAGISKYKERRRETENRIKHTRENLERLTDLREELGKQLDRLQRQARAAEKYKEYKQEERTLKGQLYALRWQGLQAELKNHQDVIGKNQIELEKQHAEQTRLDAEIEKYREAHIDETEAFNEVQARFYQVGSDIARLEQSIAHNQTRKQELQDDLQQVEEEWHTAKNLSDQDLQRIKELEQLCESLVPQVEQAQAQADLTAAERSASEDNMQAWQARWDEFNELAAVDSKTADVEQTRIQQLEQRIQNINQRMEVLSKQVSDIDFTVLETEVEHLDKQWQAANEAQTRAQAEQTELQANLKTLRTQLEALNVELDNKRREQQRMEGRLTSLQALQDAALGKQNDGLSQWLQQQGLESKQRLAEQLNVEPGWSKALEVVLKDQLEAICIDDLHDLPSWLENFREDVGDVSFCMPQTSTQQNNTGLRLIDKITSSFEISGLLSSVFIAEDLTSALAKVSQLAAHESVVTPQGVWLGPGWVRVQGKTPEGDSIFERKQAIEKLQSELNEMNALIDGLQSDQTSCKQQVADKESERDAHQQTLSQQLRTTSEIKTQLTVKTSNLKHQQTRQQQVKEEQASQQQQRQQFEAELAEARHVWQGAMTEMNTHADKRAELQAEQEHLKSALHSKRHIAQEVKNTSYKLAADLQSSQAQLEATKQNQLRASQQAEQLLSRRSHLNESLEALITPAQEAAQQLELLLEKRLEIEEELAEARKLVESHEHHIREMETLRHEADAVVEKVRDVLEQKRIQVASFQERQNTLQNQLVELDVALEAVLETLTEAMQDSALSAEIEQLATRIQRLGAINLAAIDEYEVESERKTYLDAQHEDLSSALTTLENAINKIDKETRTCFKDTFDKLNAGFKTIFPKVFGGGSAYLDLVGDDLLDAGVVLMARPPGKRNSTIHLLSGGEKAMTAIALVFAIFELNPAPFCMLDEVDAPLDDANVVRYCDTVKEMAEKTQFICISHNKLAIEMGDSLVGVTMQEPGVSRLVAVDVNEAVAMAEA